MHFKRKELIIRNFECRLWCKNKNEWEKNNWLITPYGGLIDVDHRFLPMRQDTHIKTFYTNLNDINGNKIFEGDICINHNGLGDYYYVVEWVFAGFQLVTYKKPESNVKGISDGMNYGYMEDADALEVVGNIFENKDMLGW